MKRLDLDRLSPPGMSRKWERSFFFCGLAVAWGWSCGFIGRYLTARGEMFYYDHAGAEKRLFEDAVMPDFAVLLGNALWGFVILSVCMLLMSALHYAYFYQNSKSIYVMKRLRDPMELHRRCLILPIAMALLCLLAAVLVFFLYFAIYFVFTPEECLLPGQWQKLWM